MPRSIVILTEETLSAYDASGLVALHAGEEVDYLVLVPADPHRNLLADVLDHLRLFEVREALGAVRGQDDPSRDEAVAVLEGSLASMRAEGAQVEGRVSEGEPIAALAAAVAELSASEVAIVTRPHAVEDTFHTDWASQAREQLGVPVLHLYGGTSMLG